ncbi:MAG: rhodanese-like domain-containing protein [Thermoanaerobaculales bacterium]|nr:rhodanese-like domain-containing protein [Thermoanaerobaculales bacterium]
MPGLLRILLEAIAVSAVAVVISLLFNALRPAGLELIARTPYQILVPCPEPGGPVQVVQPTNPWILSARTFLVDARSPQEFDLWHLPKAVNLPYDWLDPVPEDRLLELAKSIAASGANRVAVYGDGGRPDSGEHLGKEISGRGIKNVFFVAGGAPTMLARPSHHRSEER